jgi:hypothetical protein
MGTGDGDDPRSPVSRGWGRGWGLDPAAGDGPPIPAGKSGMGMGMIPRSPANRGWDPHPRPRTNRGWGWGWGWGSGLPCPQWPSPQPARGPGLNLKFWAQKQADPPGSAATGLCGPRDVPGWGRPFTLVSDCRHEKASRLGLFGRFRLYHEAARIWRDIGREEHVWRNHGSLSYPKHNCA